MEIVLCLIFVFLAGLYFGLCWSKDAANGDKWREDILSMNNESEDECGKFMKLK